jgi:hypothetical protein
MSGRRTNKHKNKQQKQRDLTGALISRHNAAHLLNALVDQGEVPDLQRGIDLLQSWSNHMGKDQLVVLCSHCAKKIGVRICSGCRGSNETRYCSKECQLADWPAHKATCLGHAVVDVD